MSAAPPSPAARRKAPARPPAAEGAPVLTRGPACERVVVVTRATQLEETLVRFGTRGQARFWLERAGEDWAALEAAHGRYHAALAELRRQVPAGLRVQVLERALLPQYRFDPTDAVVALGPDGLVANAAKYLDGQPLVGVNPDPERIEGVLLPVPLPGVGRVLASAARGEARARMLTMAEAVTSDGQRLLAVNDLFVGARTHVSARYRLRVGQREEAQSSSGVIVATGVGSTGWLRSVYAGARGVARACGAEWAGPRDEGRLGWEAERLVYAVREPWPSATTRATLVMGELTRAQPLVVTSQMAEGGVVFGDGVEADALPFPRGVTATIGLAAQKTRLVVA